MLAVSMERQVQKALSSLDHNLFLDKEFHPVYKCIYYVVKRRMDGLEPLRTVEWIVGSMPLPLSMDIVDRVRSQEGDIRDAMAQAVANNAAKQELLRQERLAAEENIIDEFKARAKTIFINTPK